MSDTTDREVAAAKMWSALAGLRTGLQLSGQNEAVEVVEDIARLLHSFTILCGCDTNRVEASARRLYDAMRAAVGSDLSEEERTEMVVKALDEEDARSVPTVPRPSNN